MSEFVQPERRRNVNPYPKFLYAPNGPHQGPGGTYNYIQVDNDEQYGKLLNNGWYRSVDEAISETHNEPPPAKQPKPKPKKVYVPK